MLALIKIVLLLSLWLLKVNGSHFFELKPGEFNVVVTGTSVLSVMISKLQTVLPLLYILAVISA